MRITKRMILLSADPAFLQVLQLEGLLLTATNSLLSDSLLNIEVAQGVRSAVRK